LVKRKIWTSQEGSEKPPVEGQTMQWPEEKGHKEKQYLTKTTHETKDWTTRTHWRSGLNWGASE
jgi:hypothetical protein